MISQFVAGPGSSTLPMVIFSKVRFGVQSGRRTRSPRSWCSVVASGVVAASVWMRRQNRRRERDMQLAADNR